MEKEINTLITLAREGNENAFADLVAQYRPLLDSMAKSYKKKCSNELYSEEDFIQESTLALYSAVRTYKESGGVTFGLYAKICVRNRLISLLRSASKKRDKTDLPKNEHTEPLHRLLEAEGSKEIEKKIQAVLSDLEWSVFKLYVQKKSYSEMATILGRSVKTVDNAICRIKTKLKEFM